MNIKVELTEAEAEYLRSAPFWDWKRAELDLLWHKTDKVQEAHDWYKNLYKKLGGKVDGRRNRK